MANKYKDPVDIAANISISMKIGTQAILHELAATFDSDRSKVVVALVRYLKLNLQDKKLKQEIEKQLENA